MHKNARLILVLLALLSAPAWADPPGIDPKALAEIMTMVANTNTSVKDATLAAIFEAKITELSVPQAIAILNHAGGRQALAKKYLEANTFNAAVPELTAMCHDRSSLARLFANRNPQLPPAEILKMVMASTDVNLTLAVLAEQTPRLTVDQFVEWLAKLNGGNRDFSIEKFVKERTNGSFVDVPPGDLGRLKPFASAKLQERLVAAQVVQTGLRTAQGKNGTVNAGDVIIHGNDAGNPNASTSVVKYIQHGMIHLREPRADGIATIPLDHPEWMIGRGSSDQWVRAAGANPATFRLAATFPDDRLLLIGADGQKQIVAAAPFRDQLNAQEQALKLVSEKLLPTLKGWRDRSMLRDDGAGADLLKVTRELEEFLDPKSELAKTFADPKEYADFRDRWLAQRATKWLAEFPGLPPALKRDLLSAIHGASKFDRARAEKIPTAIDTAALFYRHPDLVEENEIFRGLAPTEGEFPGYFSPKLAVAVAKSLEAEFKNAIAVYGTTDPRVKRLGLLVQTLHATPDPVGWRRAFSTTDSASGHGYQPIAELLLSEYPELPIRIKRVLSLLIKDITPEIAQSVRHDPQLRADSIIESPETAPLREKVRELRIALEDFAAKEAHKLRASRTGELKALTISLTDPRLRAKSGEGFKEPAILTVQNLLALNPDLPPTLVDKARETLSALGGVERAVTDAERTKLRDFPLHRDKKELAASALGKLLDVLLQYSGQGQEVRRNELLLLMKRWSQLMGNPDIPGHLDAISKEAAIFIRAMPDAPTNVREAFLVVVSHPDADLTQLAHAPPCRVDGNSILPKRERVGWANALLGFSETIVAEESGWLLKKTTPLRVLAWNADRSQAIVVPESEWRESLVARNSLTLYRIDKKSSAAFWFYPHAADTEAMVSARVPTPKSKPSWAVAQTKVWFDSAGAKEQLARFAQEMLAGTRAEREVVLSVGRCRGVRVVGR